MLRIIAIRSPMVNNNYVLTRFFMKQLEQNVCTAYQESILSDISTLWIYKIPLRLAS